jgi:hypothetical protein
MAPNFPTKSSVQTIPCAGDGSVWRYAPLSCPQNIAYLLSSRSPTRLELPLKPRRASLDTVAIDVRAVECKTLPAHRRERHCVSATMPPGIGCWRHFPATDPRRKGCARRRKLKPARRGRLRHRSALVAHGNDSLEKTVVWPLRRLMRQPYRKRGDALRISPQSRPFPRPYQRRAREVPPPRGCSVFASDRPSSSDHATKAPLRCCDTAVTITRNSGRNSERQIVSALRHGQSWLLAAVRLAAWVP